MIKQYELWDWMKGRKWLWTPCGLVFLALSPLIILIFMLRECWGDITKAYKECFDLIFWRVEDE